MMYSMKLSKYIQELNITQDTAAKEIGISRQYLCDILSEKKVPGRQSAFKIRKWSNRMVDLGDLWKINP